MARRSLLFFFSLLIVLLSDLQAQQIDDTLTPDQRAVFQEVEGTLLSPFCPGRLLKDCPSSAARDLKFKIKERIIRGESAPEISESIIAEFGEDLRAAPKHAGFGLVAWYAPLGFLVLGVIGVFVWIRSQI